MTQPLPSTHLRCPQGVIKPPPAVGPIHHTARLGLHTLWCPTPTPHSCFRSKHAPGSRRHLRGGPFQCNARVTAHALSCTVTRAGVVCLRWYLSGGFLIDTLGPQRGSVSLGACRWQPACDCTGAGDACRWVPSSFRSMPTCWVGAVLLER